MDGDQRSRPVPRALGALIRGAVDALRRKADSKPNDAMLFLGNGHQAFPSLVVLDPILEPVDKIVWMVIRQHAGETGRSTAFPSYTEILKGANISSHSTVARGEIGQGTPGSGGQPPHHRSAGLRQSAARDLARRQGRRSLRGLVAR
jgi:hypothetical protein